MESCRHWSDENGKKRCSICGDANGPFCLEERPSGPAFVRQLWPYCRWCWEEYERDGVLSPIQKPLVSSPAAGGPTGKAISAA